MSGPICKFYSVMVAEKAGGALFVACGDCSREAKTFAEGKRIGLINGKGLLELVQPVRAPAPPGLGGGFARKEPTLRVSRR